MDISADNEGAFRYACSCGHLKVAQWLYQIKPTLNISADDEYAFRYACSCGHLKVAQWLYQIKATLNISADDEYAFRYACENGRWDVARWLQSLCPDRYLIMMDNNEYKYEIIKLLQYFEETVSLTEADPICPICSENGITVQTVCKHSYCTECLTKWLSSHESCPYCREKIEKVFKII